MSLGKEYDWDEKDKKERERTRNPRERKPDPFKKSLFNFYNLRLLNFAKLIKFFKNISIRK